MSTTFRLRSLVCAALAPLLTLACSAAPDVVDDSDPAASARDEAEVGADVTVDFNGYLASPVRRSANQSATASPGSLVTVRYIPGGATERASLAMCNDATISSLRGWAISDLHYFQSTSIARIAQVKSKVWGKTTSGAEWGSPWSTIYSNGVQRPLAYRIPANAVSAQVEFDGEGQSCLQDACSPWLFDGQRANCCAPACGETDDPLACVDACVARKPVLNATGTRLAFRAGP
jgi:hypothetical protein